MEDKKVEPAPRKRKIILLALVVVILTGLIGGYAKRGAIVAKLSAKKNIDNKKTNGAGSLVDQYKNSLPELKNKAENNNPNDLQGYAVAQYATGDVAGAETTYRKQIRVDGNNAVAHNNLANALRDQGNYEEAIKEYKEAIRLDPKVMTSYINLGNMYQYSLDKKDEAVKVYQEAISQNPDSADAYVLLGILYESSGDKDSAKKNFQEVLDMQPENQAAKAGMERIK
jgi:tetratricopeptide (TPR) repeat protein